jgi:copper oxidase (laccase) domain-containing protein
LGADCAPLIFVDSKRPVIGVAHCGWKPLFAGIISEVLLKMQGLNSKVQDIRVAVGPALGPLSYEVDPPFRTQFLAIGVASSNTNTSVTSTTVNAKPQLTQSAIESCFQLKAGATPEKWLFNLPRLILLVLAANGIPEDHIDLVGGDTFANPQWFSYRRNLLNAQQKATAAAATPSKVKFGNHLSIACISNAKSTTKS